ncbi:MAG TPA: hypothetical protein PKW24_04830 [Clostridiales bacterium]|jgi:membrane protease YdiL (CAAX protease family)|nr:hypothetical protein [Clostridiales bacterium]
MKLLKPLLRPLALALGWAWAFWGAALYFGHRSAVRLAYGMSFLDIFFLRGNRQALMVHTLFAIGMFGALVAFFFTPEPKEEDPPSGKLSLNLVLTALALPLLLVLPAVLLSALSNFANFSDFSRGLLKVLLYFFSTLFTFSAGELFWQGRIYPILKHRLPLFRLSMLVGAFRFVWYLPVAILIYLDFDKHSNLPGLLCFVFGVFALSYILTYLYRMSDSMALVILTHALIMTANFAFTVFFPYSFFAFLPGLTAWGAVWYWERRRRAEKGLRPKNS